MFGYAILIVTLLVMKLAPQSSAGRWLHATLVERPLERIAGMDRRHVIFLLLVFGAALFASEMIMTIGSVDLFTAFAWDLSVYLDVMTVAYALAAVARARAGLKWLALRVSVGLRRGMRSRARRVRAATPRNGADNDDDPAPAWSLAA